MNKQIDIQLNRLEKRIEDKLDRIEERLDKLDKHINFIDDVYQDLKNPINVAKNSLVVGDSVIRTDSQNDHPYPPKIIQ